MMNFLLRPAQPVPSDRPTAPDLTSLHKPSTTLEGLIAEDAFSEPSVTEERNGEPDGSKVFNGGVSTRSTKTSFPPGKHTQITNDEGWITIPYKELPENWSDAESISSFHSLDRSFLFPGEQLHILVCLSASKQDTEVLTPFKVAAAMSKNGIVEQYANQQKKTPKSETSVSCESEDKNAETNGEVLLTTEQFCIKQDISESESILRSESHKQRTQNLLERFKNSHFFVRITDSSEELWTKQNIVDYPQVLDVSGKTSSASGVKPKTGSDKPSHINAVIDKGDFDASLAGGIARNVISCCSLSNGDIVVLLQVNVGNNLVKNPVLEVLQFEKHLITNDDALSESHETLRANQADPCGDLLKWLLPLDRTLPPPARPLSPPNLSSSSTTIGTNSQRSTNYASSGSQLFSFSHFRSYSMSAIPQNVATSSPVSSSYSKPSFDLENWDKHSSQNSVKNEEVGNDGLLSFRGVALEPDRFSAHCGLEGIYLPGRRWTRKIEIVQPVEIHSFSADCNSEDLLCVQIKNVAPSHTPDIVIYLDAITIVYDEAPNSWPPLSLPIACIEAGSDQSLPNLPLRRGEEHSFILKPANLTRDPKAYSERNKSFQPPHSRPLSSASSIHFTIKTHEGKKVSTSPDQYAVIVSCRCNYTESRLFFKQPISWRPRAARDLMISVASKMSEPTSGSRGGISQLPVQVLTLQASNLTSEDLTLTVLAPASFTSPPSVISLNSAPPTPLSPLLGPSGSSLHRFSTTSIVSETKEESGLEGRSISLDEQALSTVDVIPNTNLGCSHLWLQSTVPLGCVPSQSTATVKLELLPLTDGIITLDTLQIAVKEKGVTYIPEHSLKIYATSSVATGIV